MNAELWTKADCKFCVKAKRLLQNEGVDITEYRIDQPPYTREDMTRRVGREVKTVPQIFIDDEYIGGYDELTWWLAEERSLD